MTKYYSSNQTNDKISCSVPPSVPRDTDMPLCSIPVHKLREYDADSTANSKASISEAWNDYYNRHSLEDKKANETIYFKWQNFVYGYSGDIVEGTLNTTTNNDWFRFAEAMVDWGNIGGTLSNQTDLQNELDNKASVSHTHPISDITNLQSELDGKANTSHNHNISDITNLQTELDNKENDLGNPSVDGYLLSSDTSGNRSWIAAPSSGIPEAPADGNAYGRKNTSWVTVSETGHNHPISDITNLQTELNNKEDSLGNPASNGQVLSSDTSGNRSWVDTLSDAPSDGITYGRKNNAWSRAVPEPTNDGNERFRHYGGWTLADLGNLNDVAVSTASTGDVLRYNGSDWVNDSGAGFLDEDEVITGFWETSNTNFRMTNSSATTFGFGNTYGNGGQNNLQSYLNGGTRTVCLTKDVVLDTFSYSYKHTNSNQNFGIIEMEDNSNNTRFSVYLGASGTVGGNVTTSAYLYLDGATKTFKLYSDLSFESGFGINHNLNILNDVSYSTSPSNGDMLKYNGTNWVPYTPTSPGSWNSLTLATGVEELNNTDSNYSTSGIRIYNDNFYQLRLNIRMTGTVSAGATVATIPSGFTITEKQWIGQVMPDDEASGLGTSHFVLLHKNRTITTSSGSTSSNKKRISIIILIPR